MKIYVVYRNTPTENGEFREIEKAFDSLEKAEVYKSMLDEKYKDDLIFHCYSYFLVEELEVY